MELEFHSRNLNLNSFQGPIVTFLMNVFNDVFNERHLNLNSFQGTSL